MKSEDTGEIEGGDVLGVLVRLVGDDAALILLEEYGGTRMFVPLTATDATRLGNLIGLSHAGKLSVEFGGRYVRIPVGRAWRGTMYRKRGWTYPKIAKALCMTDSAVARMLKTETARNFGTEVRLDLQRQFQEAAE